ncbi:hypothetical protein OPQ81_002587 [Rhizoctonia solani]|nr:hypothetical protein OPQ81_002587 [Rhizoctonia solani]
MPVRKNTRIAIFNLIAHWFDTEVDGLYFATVTLISAKIESVTETSVHFLTSSTVSNLDQGYNDFLQNDGATILIPESLSPKFEMEGKNSWVIHVGWPVSEAQYITQRRNHQAQNNIVVAYSGDQSLYPSGDRIIELTEHWPQDGTSFRASVSILRPLYEAVLSEISLEMKTRVYQDWLQFHGIHGPRRVKTWTTSMMVQRANDFILKALQWSGPHTGDIPSPEVSAGFVAQNELQSAVQEGILRVEDDDSDHPEPSTIPTPRPESALTQIEFQPKTGHTYFALDEEFDAIPLMCYIAGKYEKVICFLEGQGALRYYQKLFAKILGRQILFPTVLNNNRAIEEAVVQFLDVTPPAILLLASNTTSLPQILNQGSIDCCIYWGFNVPFRHAKKNRVIINCDTTIIIMTAAQQRALPGSHDLRKHPSSAIPLDLTDNSILAPWRNKTKSALTSDKTLVRELYTNRVYGVGAIPRTSLSAEEAARRANQYAARVLLHGELADGSENFPPVAGRPLVPRVAVEKFNLQPAVDAGLLTVAG